MLYFSNRIDLAFLEYGHHDLEKTMTGRGTTFISCPFDLAVGFKKLANIG